MLDIKSVKGLCILAVIMTVVSVVVQSLGSMLAIGYYMDPAYFGVWSKFMMPDAGPPPASFFILSLGFAFLSWAIFGFAYHKLGNAPALAGKDELKKGMKFGTIAWLLAGLAGNMSQYLLFNLPLGLIAMWSATSLILYWIGGMLAAKLIRP